MSSFLEIKDVYKTFDSPQGPLCVLENINLSISKGESISLLGYSGCGKTTLLRILCAFEGIDSGMVTLDGNEYKTPTKDVLMLFQEFNQLFPWKTVMGNIVHALRVTKTAADRQEAKSMAKEILREVGLYDFRHSYPNQLSGGMKQRAAFARALVLKPQVLVMDEPFANLDHVNRVKLQKLTRDMCKKYNITLVFVTHDIEEATIMADRIVVMNANPGRIRTILDNTYVKTDTEEDRLAMQTEIIRYMEK